MVADYTIVCGAVLFMHLLKPVLVCIEHKWEICGRFVRLFLHIYPACSHVTALLTATALFFYLLQSPCMCLARLCVYPASRPVYPLINTALVGIFETKSVIQIKQPKHFHIIYFMLRFYDSCYENLF